MANCESSTRHASRTAAVRSLLRRYSELVSGNVRDEQAPLVSDRVDLAVEPSHQPRALPLARLADLRGRPFGVRLEHRAAALHDVECVPEARDRDGVLPLADEPKLTADSGSLGAEQSPRAVNGVEAARDHEQ